MLAEAFLEFLLSDEGQQIFADYGFRPVNPERQSARPACLPLPAKLFTMADLGGWAKVEEALYGPKGSGPRSPPSDPSASGR